MFLRRLAYLTILGEPIPGPLSPNEVGFGPITYLQLHPNVAAGFPLWPKRDPIFPFTPHREREGAVYRGLFLRRWSRAPPHLRSNARPRCCEEHNLLGLLTLINPSPPPFTHLERIVIFGPESGLRKIAKTRRDRGVLPKTLVVGRGSGRFEYDRPEGYAGLGQLVDDLCIRCPTEILEWKTGNEIPGTWLAIEVSDLVSSSDYLKVLG